MVKETLITERICDLCGKEVDQFVEFGEWRSRIVRLSIAQRYGGDIEYDLCVECNDYLLRCIDKKMAEINDDGAV